MTTLIKKYQDGKCGFVDEDGNWQIEPQFDEGKNFSEGKAAVRIKNRWGYIDESGNFIIEPIFNGGYFNECGKHLASSESF